MYEMLSLHAILHLDIGSMEWLYPSFMLIYPLGVNAWDTYRTGCSVVQLLSSTKQRSSELRARAITGAEKKRPLRRGGFIPHCRSHTIPRYAAAAAREKCREGSHETS